MFIKTRAGAARTLAVKVDADRLEGRCNRIAGPSVGLGFFKHGAACVMRSAFFRSFAALIVHGFGKALSALRDERNRSHHRRSLSGAPPA